MPRICIQKGNSGEIKVSFLILNKENLSAYLRS